MDVTRSVILQQLLPLASPGLVGEVLAELSRESGLEFKTMSCERHVMERALRQMPRWREKTSSEDKSATTEGDAETEGKDYGILEAQVLSLCRMVREHCAEFIRHTHGSHVARTLIHVLAGCLGPARPVCVTNAIASTVLQTMLTVCHRNRPKLCKPLTKGIVKYLPSLSFAPGVSPLLVFLKDQASSRHIETVLQLSHKALLRDFYKNNLQGQLVTLAIHPIANFPIQRLTAASTNYKSVSEGVR